MFWFIYKIVYQLVMGYLIPKFITMVMKEYSTFPKATALLKPRHQIVSCHIQDIRCGEGSYPLLRSSLFFSFGRVGHWTLFRGVGVFCSPTPSRPGPKLAVIQISVEDDHRAAVKKIAISIEKIFVSKEEEESIQTDNTRENRKCIHYRVLSVQDFCKRVFVSNKLSPQFFFLYE